MTKQHISFEFDTRNYEWTHGRAPKGYGMWAFAARESHGKEVIWAPSSTYGEAKNWIKNHIRNAAPADYRGYVVIEVLT
jgi:hypothetical protein